MRRSAAWLSALPLILAGSQVAHVFAYRWVYPSSQVRLQALLSSGHGYLDRLPLVLAVAGAVLLVSLLVGLADAARGQSLRALPAWAFALLPVATFVLQEILERSFHTGAFVWQAVESPTFLPGLLLQLPFGAVAYVVARLVLRAASSVGELIRTHRRLPRTRPVSATVRRFAVLVRPPRLAPLAAGAAGRAPPLLAR